MEHYRSIIETDKKMKKSKMEKDMKKNKPIKEGFVSRTSITQPTIKSDKVSRQVSKNKMQNLQPQYETKLDRIYRNIEDRYDNSEHKLIEDYNKAYMDYLEAEKEKSFDINPIQALTDFEESLYSMIDGKTKSQHDTTYGRRVYPGNIASYFDKDNIPAKGDDLTKNMSRDTPPAPTTVVVEGFANEKDTDIEKGEKKEDSSIRKLKKKIDKAKVKKPIKEEKGITIDSLLTGDTVTNILQYGIDNTSNLLGTVNISSNSIGDFTTKEENMMPIGIMMIIASLLLYFTDLSS